MNVTVPVSSWPTPYGWSEDEVSRTKALSLKQGYFNFQVGFFYFTSNRKKKKKEQTKGSFIKRGGRTRVRHSRWRLRRRLITTANEHTWCKEQSVLNNIMPADYILNMIMDIFLLVRPHITHNQSCTHYTSHQSGCSMLHVPLWLQPATHASLTPACYTCLSGSSLLHMPLRLQPATHASQDAAC